MRVKGRLFRLVSFSMEYQRMVFLVIALSTVGTPVLADNVCLLRSCGSLCTRLGYFPSPVEACSPDTPKRSSGNSYYCYRYDYFDKRVSCNGTRCPTGSKFNNDIGECVTDEKPTCASTVGDPIDVRNGNNYQTESDASGGGLNLQRHYLYTVGPNPEALGQGQWLFPYTQSIEIRTTAYGDSAQTSYAVNWTGGVRYVFKGNQNIGYAFTSWQQPPFDSVEAMVDASGEPSGWRLLAKSGVEYTFDNNGQLTEIDELHGKVLAIETTIDSEGNPIQRQINNLASQASLTYSYNTVNQVIETAVLARNGTSLTFAYTYNTDGMLSQITYPDGSARTYLYEDARYPQALSGISDNGNTLASWEYDAQGRTHRNTLGDGKDETSLQFNSDGTTTVTNALGKESIFSFTSVNGSTLVAKVDGQASQNCAAANQSFTYTASGRIETATDWSGHITRYEYNDRGQVTQKTLVEGTAEQQTISTTWHPTFDEPIRIKKGERVQEFCYDPEGNVTRQATRDMTEPELNCANR